MSGPVKGLLAPGMMEQPQSRGLLGMLYPQGWRGGLFGMGNPTGSYLDQMELSRPGVNPGASPMSNRDLARQYAVNLGSGMGTDAGGAANIGAGLLGTVKMYHGTPHTFDAFDLSKIGTGEGAQAYGHGLYFAENPGVAKSYRDGLTKPINPAHDPDAEINALWPQFTDGKGLVTINGVSFNSPESLVSWAQSRPQILDGITPVLANAVRKQFRNGSLYTVEHPANPEDFLHWDKPLNEQSEKVQDALERAGIRTKSTITDEMIKNATPVEAHFLRNQRAHAENNSELTGHQVLVRLARNERGGVQEYDYPAASAALREAGIPGIRYLDQGSRGTGEGTHNYVVFDDKPLKILSRE